MLVLLGVGMIIPRVEALLERPFSRIPQRSVDTDRGGFVLGLALGAVYVPCAGPVLAAITVAGATGRIGAETVVLTVSFAVGTAIPLLIFALAGRRVAERVRAFRTHQRALRVGAGVVVIGLAVADPQRDRRDPTSRPRLHDSPEQRRRHNRKGDEGSGSRPEDLPGRLRAEGRAGAADHRLGELRAGASGLGHPAVAEHVALDNDYATWNNFGNNAWPADYLIDANGVVRKVEIGEGNYPGTESLIRKLLTAANRSVALPPATDIADTTPTSALTPETYLDPARASNYAGHPALAPGTSTFTYRPSVPPDEFALAGTWTVGQESLSAKKNAAIKLNYLAAHIYLDVGGKAPSPRRWTARPAPTTFRALRTSIPCWTARPRRTAHSSSPCPPD